MIHTLINYYERPVFQSLLGMGMAAAYWLTLPEQSMYQREWVVFLILLAPLAWFPMASVILGRRLHPAWHLTISVGWLLSFSLPTGWPATLLCLPWFTYLLREVGILAPPLLSSKPRDWQGKDLLTLAAYAFGLVAVGWALADRIGYQILDFNPLMGLLTVAHFHYAGLLLTLVASWIYPYFRLSIKRRILWLLLSGIPATAVGITVTHLGGPRWIESCSATLMVAAGCYLAWLQGQLATRSTFTQAARYCFGLGSVLLFVGMALALLYGWNHWLHIPWLSIPWMYAVHGSFNTLTLGAIWIPGWWIVHRQDLSYAG
ncbi:MAG: YndJ family transporter [Bacteroidota bacterium]